jgi:hypothetical protein
MKRSHTAGIRLGAVPQLRGDLDLGLRMVEGLIRIGEVGAAARLTDELRDMCATSIVRPGGPRRVVRLPRRVLVGAGAAAAIAASGLSAAAVLGPSHVSTPPRTGPAVPKTTDVGPARAPAGQVSAPATVTGVAGRRTAEAVQAPTAGTAQEAGPPTDLDSPALLPADVVPTLDPGQLPTPEPPAPDR